MPELGQGRRLAVVPRMLELPLLPALGLFLVAAAAVAWAGSRLESVADELAQVTGIGRGLAGGLFLGATTSLPGIVTSVTAVIAGEPGLAIGNALGGIAAQTAFFAAADAATARDLRRTAASLPNLMQAALVLLLLGLVLMASGQPEAAIGPVHVVSPLIVLAYMYGLLRIRQARTQPQWQPVEPFEVSGADGARDTDARRIWLRFGGLALVVAVAGWAIATASISLATATGLGPTLFGTVFTAIATSSPELVTAVAAVRSGHPRIGAGDILGGNAFDVLLIVIADAVYLQGPIFAELGEQHRFVTALAVTLGTLLLIGLLRRGGIRAGRMAVESLLIVGLYLAGMAILFVGG